ncbi:unnamed protein product [Caenorhabditis angaria]|uniref:Tyrosine-protein kinase n=1 Tax=Caenorhabditis angaria TaxID=860376 RepID=A0A9P1IMY3_9PELO|nr:unnamed protein product [Caenorhabditis angaria]
MAENALYFDKGKSNNNTTNTMRNNNTSTMLPNTLDFGRLSSNSGTNRKKKGKSRSRRPSTSAAPCKTVSSEELTGGSAGTSEKIVECDPWIDSWSKKLVTREWYHGVMPREDTNSLLKKDGDFLVRRTTEKSKIIFCLTVFHDKEPRHFVLLNVNGFWTLKGLETSERFEDLVELLNYLTSKRKPLLPNNSVILVRAISRSKFYILHDDILLTDKLGSGAFGQVWKGKWKRMNEGEEVQVAVKRLKEGNIKKAMLKEFVREAKLMMNLSHPNLVRFVGIAPTEEPLMILLELAGNGCLKSHLKKENSRNTVTFDDLAKFCIDTARGMTYLASKMVIHRDVAARNLLLGDNMEVKISDFGLAKCGKAEVKCTKLKVPIRWLAPESIDTLVFTTKSDVWSFGVTIWEILAYCSSDPFPGLTNAEAKDIIRTKSPPMDAPIDTPKHIAAIMYDCFAKKPEFRPSFMEILKKLSPDEDIEVFKRNTPLDPISSKSESGRKQKRKKKYGKRIDGWRSDEEKRDPLHLHEDFYF